MDKSTFLKIKKIMDEIDLTWSALQSLRPQVSNLPIDREYHIYFKRSYNDKGESMGARVPREIWLDTKAFLTQRLQEHYDKLNKEFEEL